MSSCILFVDEDDVARKVNIDELYEKNHRRDLKQVAIFNKILNRVHKRITLTSRNTQMEKHIWFAIPSFIFGEPVYDQTECIAYVITKLEENGFFIRYMHPSTLFISWDNWVPSYTRHEIKKKTGIVLDEKGNIIDRLEKSGATNDLNSTLLNERSGGAPAQKEQKQYTPIDKYKPTGNLIYGKDTIEKLEKKVTFG
jgi:hypothetical protein